MTSDGTRSISFTVAPPWGPRNAPGAHRKLPGAALHVLAPRHRLDIVLVELGSHHFPAEAPEDVAKLVAGVVETERERARLA